MEKESTVVLFKSEDDNDRFKLALNEHGFQAVFIPVLSFSFVNEKVCRQTFENLALYDTLFITSKRVSQALEQFGILSTLQRWLLGKEQCPTVVPRRLFVVGSATANHLLSKLSLCPDDITERLYVGARSQELIDQVSKLPEHSSIANALYLCGDSRLDLLPSTLRQKAGLQFTEVVVYRSVVVEQSLTPTQLPCEVDWLVFFSPSGLAALPPVPPASEEHAKFMDSFHLN